MACNPDQIKLAVFEQTKLITDFTYEKINQSNSTILGKIPDGGVVENDDNNDSIIYGWGEQAPVSYRTVDYDNKPLVEGQMTGRYPNTALSAPFTVDINDIPDNACHGQTEIDFSQGFRRRGFLDREFSAKTPVKCVRELDRFTRRQAADYFNGMRDSFANFGKTNFEDDLINLTIRYGEANASVTGTELNVTTGGWESPPLYRITIDFLQEYRDYVMVVKRGLGQDVPDDWMLEIEIPRRDWIDAVREDQIQRNGTGNGVVYNTELFKDDEGPLRGRSFATYGGIKAYFREDPIRGYFKPKGDGTYNFVRVKQFINSDAEVGGIVLTANQQYRRDSIVVDGVTYPMVTLIPHIDKTSFTRFGKKKPLKPVGEENVGVNYEVKVIDGAYIDCNEMNDKFRLVARHEYRFRAKYPELSGWIAYRNSQRVGYTLSVTPRAASIAGDVTAFEEIYREQDIDSCTQAECAQCDQVVDSQNLQCIDPEDATAGILALTPSGEITSPTTTADPTTVRLAVTRTGGLGSVVTVAYATADGTATAGSDYTAASGTLTWEIGDNTPKFIEVALLAAATDAQTLTVTISSPTNATIAASQNVANITIDKLS